MSLNWITHIVNKKLMTMGLNAIKGVANGFVVKGLMTLVEKAIVILGAC